MNRSKLRKKIFSNRRILYKCAAFLIIFIALIWFRFCLSFPIPKNSDDANNFLAGVEMAGGNWDLGGWVLAPDNLYFTDILMDAILVRLGGTSPNLLYWHAAILWSLVIVTAVAMSMAGLRQRQAIFSGMAVTTLLAITVPTHHLFGWFTLISSHASTILLALVSYWLSINIITNSKRIALSCLAFLWILTFVGSFSDPIFVIISVLPIAGFCMLLPKRNSTFKMALVGGVATSFVAAKIAFILMTNHGGFEMTPMKVGFATYPDVFDHIQLGTRSVLGLLGADFTGVELHGGVLEAPYISVFRFPYFLLLLVSVIGFGVKFFSYLTTWPDTCVEESRSAYLDLLLFLGIVFNFSSVVVTTAITDDSGSRYFIPGLVFGIILMARRCSQYPLFASYAGVVFAASALFAVEMLSHGPSKPVLAIKPVVELEAELRALGLRNGYAGFWESSIITAISAQQIRVLSLKEDGNVRRWFANMNWYTDAVNNWRGDIFFVGKKNGENHALPQDLIMKKYGEPSRKISVGQYVINVYDNRNGGLQLPILGASVDRAFGNNELKLELSLIGSLLYDQKTDALILRVGINNASGIPISSSGKHPITIGASILDSDGGTDQFPGYRDYLHANISPVGANSSAYTDIELPLGEGNALGNKIRIQPVQEGIAWIGDRDGAPKIEIGPFQRCADEHTSLCNADGSRVPSLH